MPKAKISQYVINLKNKYYIKNCINCINSLNKHKNINFYVVSSVKNTYNITRYFVIYKILQLIFSFDMAQKIYIQILDYEFKFFSNYLSIPLNCEIQKNMISIINANKKNYIENIMLSDNIYYLTNTLYTNFKMLNLSVVTWIYDTISTLLNARELLYAHDFKLLLFIIRSETLMTKLFISNYFENIYCDGDFNTNYILHNIFEYNKIVEPSFIIRKINLLNINQSIFFLKDNQKNIPMYYIDTSFYHKNKFESAWKALKIKTKNKMKLNLKFYRKFQDLIK